MGRAKLFYFEMRRALRIAGRAFYHVAFPPRYDPDVPSTADWHKVPEGHPSLLCKCPDGGNGHFLGDHLPDCQWAAAACKACTGSGYCQECMGDGCAREEAKPTT